MELDIITKIKIILIIVGIIQLITLLCFIFLEYHASKIRRHLIHKEDFEAKFKFLMYIGDKEKARELLINKILNDTNIFTGDPFSFTNVEKKTQKCFSKYGDKLRAVGINVPYA